MVVKFNKIKLHNFCSYSDAEINLLNKGFCLVSGRNKCKKDNALSNGSGKSTIWSAICYAITGETISGIKTNLKNINSDENDCYVILNFCVDNDEYEIRRIIAPKSDLKIIKNNVDISGKGIRESEKALAENLPDLTKDLIASTIILGQGMPNKFSSFSPSGRKDLLEKLTKSDFMIEDIRIRLANRQEELNKQLRTIEDSLLINNTQLKTAELSLNSLNAEVNSFVEKNYDELISNYETKISVNQAELNKLETESNSIDIEIEDSNNKILALTTQKATESNAEIIEYTNKYNALIGEKNAKLATLKYLNADINKMKSIKDICPTCGQKLLNVVKPDTSEKEAEVVKINNEISEIDSKILVESNNHKNYTNSIEEKYSNITILQESIKPAKNRKQSLLYSISNLNSQIKTDTEALNKIKYDKENSNRIKLAALQKIDELNSQIKDLNNNINISLIGKADIDARLAVDKKIEAKVKRDFRGYLLYNIIEYLNNKAKEYSKIVFDTDELNIYLDGNSLDISYCNKLYESLSGGEKQRVDIITQFAIRDLLQTYFNYSSNILVLDEITDNLDKLATDKIFDLIIDKLKDVESIFIISHHDDELAIPLDTEIQVIKNENSISSIKEIN